MNKTEYRLTVTLTDAPPVRIYTADWPTIAHVPDGHDRWIVIRRHKDGRTLVSAVNREADPVRRAGYLVSAGENPAHPIHMAGIFVGLPETITTQAIAALPAVSLESEDDGRVAVRLLPETWTNIVARLRECGWGDIPKRIESQLGIGKEQVR